MMPEPNNEPVNGQDEQAQQPADQTPQQLHYEVKVETHIPANAFIMHHTATFGGGIVQGVSTVVSLNQENVRNALMELGWTPPDSKRRIVLPQMRSPGPRGKRWS